MKIARSITRFVYYLRRVLALIKKFRAGKILRPSVTQFTMNYIVLDSLLERKAGLYQIFVNAKRQESKYVKANIEGSHVKDMVTSQQFFTQARRVLKAIKPLCTMLRDMDCKRYP